MNTRKKIDETFDRVRTHVYVDPKADRGSANMARYNSVKRRLLAAGHSASSGSGWGAGAFELVRTSATNAAAHKALRDAPYYKHLAIDKPLG
jgi:hypothetical protein